MILFDTETTGLMRPEIVPIDQQPEIIEVGIVKLRDADLSEVERFSCLIRPRILPLQKVVTDATKITEEMLKTAPSFARVLPKLIMLFLGEEIVVGHNVGFDMDVLYTELLRLGRAKRFPFPPTHLDTVEMTMDLEADRKKSPRLSLGHLYEVVTGKTMPVKHRALDDAAALGDILRALRAKDGRV